MVNDRRLFQPLKLGRAQLEHRVAVSVCLDRPVIIRCDFIDEYTQLAPLTRFRAPNHVVSDLQATYYAQRASKGGLLITEATFISKEAGGFPTAPGIYTKEQIEGWKKVTDKVHSEKNGVIYLQLWAIGRANSGDEVKDIVSASDLPFEGGKKPRPLSKEEIKQYIEWYRIAALNAIEAGFDGVEIHS